MSGNKILEVGPELSRSSRHMNLYFKNRHWDTECLLLPDRDLAEIQTWLPYVEEGAVAFRLKPEDSAILLKLFPRLPTAVRWLESADTLVKENKEWWPRLFIYDTLRKVVIERFRDLNIGLHCYVIGANHLGRAAVAAMASLGFSKISLVDEDEAQLHKEVAYLKRYLLGIQLDAVPAETLTVQTHPGSLMLNTLKIENESSILKDLSYFNFMNQGAAVIDISETCSENQLLEEALRADLKVLTGLEVQAQEDVDLITRLFPERYVTYADYYESFVDHLEQLKNPPSV